MVTEQQQQHDMTTYDGLGKSVERSTALVVRPMSRRINIRSKVRLASLQVSLFVVKCTRYKPKMHIVPTKIFPCSLDGYPDLKRDAMRLALKYGADLDRLNSFIPEDDPPKLEKVNATLIEVNIYLRDQKAVVFLLSLIHI